MKRSRMYRSIILTAVATAFVTHAVDSSLDNSISRSLKSIIIKRRLFQRNDTTTYQVTNYVPETAYIERVMERKPESVLP